MVILKVSDFRSAIIQSKFLAKKGLEVSEFRVESGLNCGGHAFPSNGTLLPSLLQEFKEKREQFEEKLKPWIKKYYKKMGWEYNETSSGNRPLITVQGGIGTNGEMRRLREDFNIDLAGWASPFLLVPEVSRVDNSTRNILRNSDKEKFYVSDVSPLGIPFNNVRSSGSELWTRKKAEEGRPGSPCRRGFLVSNTEFTKNPICVASSEYQKIKLAMIDKMPNSNSQKDKLRKEIVEKTCLCGHLGNGALITLGIVNEKNSPQSICPGPNLTWFKKIYTLKETVDHIYGRGPSLVPSGRPHMFANEIEMYVDYFKKQVARCTYTPVEIKKIQVYKANLEDGMDFCLDIAKRNPYDGENLISITRCVEKQKALLESIYLKFEKNTKNPNHQIFEKSSKI